MKYKIIKLNQKNKKILINNNYNKIKSSNKIWMKYSLN